MHRVRGQVGRAQVGGLSLLLAVAVLAAAGSGVETARRVAFAGAGLAYAVCADVPAAGAVQAEPRVPVLVGIAKPVRSVGEYAGDDASDASRALVAGGWIDLPPPLLTA